MHGISFAYPFTGTISTGGSEKLLHLLSLVSLTISNF
jgi:hypothetical protein